MFIFTATEFKCFAANLAKGDLVHLFTGSIVKIFELCTFDANFDNFLLKNDHFEGLETINLLVF